MVRATGLRTLAILLLCFCINFAAGDRWGAHVYRRDNPTSQLVVSTIPAPASPSEAPQKGGDSSVSNGGSDSTSSGDAQSTSAPGSILVTISRTRTVMATTVVGTATASTNPLEFNSTATPDALPVNPAVTPGFGVVGAILIITGVVYTLVGIKNKRLHIFLSAAYLAGLSVTVLVIYVMNPPVGNAVQGAYVVAATTTGLILGGGAIIFADMTEGLGCLLGGFSLSMWLLSLKAGGLLTTTSSKAIFIAVFTLAVFATSFSHHTRPYGLIGSISFSGATVVVIGIDCFSRAGLKEFWAWIWDLNSNLFPIGATNYPLTRGIRVEIAVIIVLFLMGVVSQMKLWKIIKERRERRAAERLEDERAIEQEEENVGKRVEDLNAGERSQWEAIYGDKDPTGKPAVRSQRDSGVGDMESQKKGPTSIVTSARHSRENGIEMSDMPSPTQTSQVGLVMPENGQQDSVTVHSQLTSHPESPLEIAGSGNKTETLQKQQSHASLAEKEQTRYAGSNEEAPERLSNHVSNSLPSIGIFQGPKIVPLLFKVLEGEIEDDQTSVEALAEDEEEIGLSKMQSNRLSAGSAILRRLSKQSLMSPSLKSSKILSTEQGQSTEDLIPPYVTDDCASSIAATVDGITDEARSIRDSIDEAPNKDGVRLEEYVTPSPREAQPDVSKLDLEAGSPSERTEEPNRQSLALSTNLNSKAEVSQEPEFAVQTEPDAVKSSRDARSIASTSESRSMSLTKEMLPASLPRVAMSYRTNEWAKHLSTAEAPEIEEMKPEEDLVEDQPSSIEISAPVNVEDLQQTAETAAPALRPSTSLTTKNVPLAVSRPGRTSFAAHHSIPDDVITPLPQTNTLSRSASQHSIQSQPAPNRFRVSSGPAIPQSIIEYPVEEAFASPSPPPGNVHPSQNVPFGSTTTLIGQRESMVRNKSFPAAQFPLSTTPELPTNFSSPYQSQYQSLATSRAGSDAGSTHNYQNNINSFISIEDDDDISLSARRELLRQSSLHQVVAPPLTFQQTPAHFDSHQPRREPSGPSGSARERQLASFRASVRQDIQDTAVPKMTVQRQRSALWQERQAEEQRKALEARRRGDVETVFDERMRRGDMLDVHREALRKMQAHASKNA